MTKTNLLGMTIEEMMSFAAELGEAPFRGKQLFRWINRGIRDFSQMTDFSKALREKLDTAACVEGVEILHQQHDRKDGTRKFLYGLHDGNAVEGVFMKYRYGNSLCISSQVGCRMGCRFCASALCGFVRNLTAGEMLDQVMAAERYTGETISHIVVMGMGEPFDNYDNLKKFLQIIHFIQHTLQVSAVEIPYIHLSRIAVPVLHLHRLVAEAQGYAETHQRHQQQ